MQILKKRNATEPFNYNKNSSVVNYDSWLDDFYNRVTASNNIAIFSNRPDAVNLLNMDTTVVCGTSTKEENTNTWRHRGSTHFDSPVSGLLQCNIIGSEILIQNYFVDLGYIQGVMACTVGGMGRTTYATWGASGNSIIQLDTREEDTAIPVVKGARVYFNVHVWTREELSTPPTFDITSPNFPMMSFLIQSKTNYP